MIKIYSMALVFSLFSSVSFAGEGSYSGQYMMEVENEFLGQAKLEFLINSKDKVEPLRVMTNDVWDDTSYTDVYFKRVESFNSQGPFLEHATFAFTYGSDEDGFAAYIKLAWIGDRGSRELTLLSSITLYEDGPNSYNSVEKNNVKFFKWNTKSKKYIEVSKI